MDIKNLEKFLEENKQPKFRLKQILQAVYRDGVSSFGEITTLPKALGSEASKLRILPFEVDKVLVAKDGRSAKAALKLDDGNIIETVLLLPMPNVWSVCVSTQAGCPMGCAFCATGKGGFKRNLTAEEITDQVLFWRQWLRNRGFRSDRITTSDTVATHFVSNVVYMGMGEPFLNWENVEESLQDLIDPQKFGFGSRSISVSTCGIPEGIIKFAKLFPQINLALSLHFADDEERSRYMPVNRKYNLDELKKALREYFQITNRKVFVEYVMLAGINDRKEDAEKLVSYLKGIGDMQLLHVNLIRYNFSSVIASEAKQSHDNIVGELKNEIAAVASLPRNDMFQSSSKNKTMEFKNYLLQNKINATIRKSLGEEIQGACGQLASH